MSNAVMSNAVNSQVLQLLEKSGFDMRVLLTPLPGGFPREDILVLESLVHLVVQDCLQVAAELQKDGASVGTALDSKTQEHWSGALNALKEVLCARYGVKA